MKTEFLSANAVILDTSIIRQIGLDPASPSRTNLKLMQNAGVDVLLPEIVLSELRRWQIDEHAKDQDLLRKLKGSPRLSKKDIVELQNLVKPDDEIRRQAYIAVARFSSGFTSLKVHRTAMQEALFRYECRQSPFQSDRKKDEWKDALILISAQKWCHENKKKGYTALG